MRVPPSIMEMIRSIKERLDQHDKYRIEYLREVYELEQSIKALTKESERNAQLISGQGSLLSCVREDISDLQDMTDNIDKRIGDIDEVTETDEANG